MKKGKYAKWTSEEGLEKIEKLAATGTDEELIAAMGCAASTFYKWLKDHREIAEAIERGRNGALAADANENVERSLYERCLGGPKEVIKAIKVREVEYDSSGRKIRETERIEQAVETTYVPADVNAIKFWLTNRDPEKWRNKVELGAKTDKSILISLSGEAADYAK